jgi:hypothetical protein
MKIALRIFAVLCVLWGVVLPMLPTLPPPDSASAMALWWWGATKEADEILARSNEPVVIGATNMVSISRSSLSLLAMRAKEPIRKQAEARFFLWASSAFALVAGVSLFLLSRRGTDERDTSA